MSEEFVGSVKFGKVRGEVVVDVYFEVFVSVGGDRVAIYR